MTEAGVLPGVDVRALLGYLTRIGVVDAAAAAGPGVRVTDLSRSHLVLSVRFGDGRHVVVKRARPRPGEVAGDLGREVLAYRIAGSNRALAEVLPAPLWLDPAGRVLVTEAVEPGTTLYADALRNGPPPVGRARELGRVVGTWHRGTSSCRTGLSASTPWVLGILTAGSWRPPEADRVLVHGEVRRELRAAFAELTAALAPSCLIHGDLKWDNCLIDARGGVRVADWEHATFGDPAWDVAGILQDYVAVSRASGERPGHDESIAAFLSAYLDFVEPAHRQRFAERAARLTGARLVQTALEYAATGVDLLGDALRVLREPRTLLAAGSTW
ncbi:MAG: aminoglycoside phosphotransferase family protein [Saccharothrix sp.]|nr:aminoglycoside phosphotransferase family protein [Saccharothrix sp.]